MKAFFAFTKKEIYDFSRTYKLFVFLILFAILGFMNPVSAKFLPELMKDFMPEGISITLAEPVLMDSWLQFFKNTPQIGLIVLVIIFSGTTAQELSKGTLIHLLTKGLKRSTVILSKFLSASLLWTLGYSLAFLVTFFYNMCFWSYESIPNLLWSALCIWIFGLLLISAVILGGILFQSTYGGLLFTGALFVGMLLLNMPKSISKWNPICMVTQNTLLLTKELNASDLYLPAAVTLAAAVFLLCLSILSFNRKQL